MSKYQDSKNQSNEKVGEKILRKSGLINSGCKSGWEVKGLELSDYYANEIKKDLGIEVEVANFLDYETAHAHYNLITLCHVLEHLSDSKLAMNQIHKLLAEGGHAMLEFPNINSLEARVKRFLQKTGLREKKYKADWVP